MGTATVHPESPWTKLTHKCVDCHLVSRASSLITLTQFDAHAYVRLHTAQLANAHARAQYSGIYVHVRTQIESSLCAKCI